MPLATATDAILVERKGEYTIAKDIEMWLSSDKKYVVSFSIITQKKGYVQGTGMVFAYMSDYEPPHEDALFHALCRRAYLLGRTIFDEDAADLLAPYLLARALNA